MYETMLYWETADFLSKEQSPVDGDWMRLWRAADKVVYSRSLTAISSARTRIERTFDPDAVQSMKRSAEHDITIGGPGLATQAFRAGLVDRCQLFLTPAIVGGGKPVLPTGVRARTGPPSPPSLRGAGWYSSRCTTAVKSAGIATLTLAILSDSGPEAL